MSKAIYVRAGDVFFTHSNSLLGKLIRWGERDKGEPDPWANHMGVIVQSGWIGPDPLPGPEAVIVEALWKTRQGTWEGWAEGTEIRVFRPRPEFNSDELLRFMNKASSYVGDTYGWFKLLGFLGKKITGINIPKYFFIDNRPICSYEAGEVVNAARKIGTIITRQLAPIQTFVAAWPGFGCLPQETEPADAMEFCLAHAEFWEEVR